MGIEEAHTGGDAIVGIVGKESDYTQGIFVELHCLSRLIHIGSRHRRKPLRPAVVATTDCGNPGKRCRNLPQGEERHPVDIRHHLIDSETEVIYIPHQRHRSHISTPIDASGTATSLDKRHKVFLRLIVTAQSLLRLLQRGDIGCIGEKAVCHRRHFGGIAGVSHHTTVFRCNLHGCVERGSGSPAYHQRNGHSGLLHRSRNAPHLLERRSDKSAQCDDVGIVRASGIENCFERDHRAEVNYVESIATQHHSHNVFPDIMHIAFHRGNYHSGARRIVGIGFRHIRLEPIYGVLHGTRTLHHLRQEEFAFAEKHSHAVHSVHQGAIDDFHRRLALVNQQLQELRDILFPTL